ncbi:hypothetical protein H7271_00290 [Bittarella massiliensis]|uniref:hypothetical protein n=1 Tax=Bittarella massiliensis (ex Durand et al. 2017) TaxID=1720313 RepID=UPI00163BE2D6|nr:hypothetical protein [Bittarella massiliensis (ex Durand et al. 2017)]MBC2870039.1 hypothetical protein [Bittarella massiliensis (ex Durand et al. 2017)]
MDEERVPQTAAPEGNAGEGLQGSAAPYRVFGSEEEFAKEVDAALEQERAQWAARGEEVARHLGVTSLDEVLELPSPQLVEEFKEAFAGEWEAVCRRAPALTEGVGLEELAGNRQFVSLLAQGLSPLAGYLACYAERVLERIQPPARPREGALEGDPAGVLGEDVAAFTDERLEEISRAVKRGRRIRL